MNSAYLKIKNINTLDDVLSYLKTIENKDDVTVWLDWDDNIVNGDDNQLIEPDVAKELFSYMINNKIFFSIITGRFYNTVCDETKRNIFDIQHNITTTIFPVLNQLGINVNNYLTNRIKQTIDKIYNYKGKCIGILYMGIFFSGNKGETINHYLRQAGISKNIKIFVDDYEPYLIEVTSSVPDIIAFRMKPYYL